jgi:hypothetical protein
MYVHGDFVNKETGFHTTKIRRAFRRLVLFRKIFWGTGVDRCEGRTLGRRITQWVNIYIPI